LGYKTTCKLYRIREERRKVTCKMCTGKNRKVISRDARTILQDIDKFFREELTAIEGRPPNIKQRDLTDTATTSVTESAAYNFTLITFQVNNTLFRVPRQHFERESKILCKMLELPQGVGSQPDGNSDAQPLPLDVDQEDFQQLLRVMFPSRVRAVEDLSVLQWMSVLKMARFFEMDDFAETAFTRMSTLETSRENWLAILDMTIERINFPDARSLGIQNLSSMLNDDVEKVSLARRYQVQQWFRSGLQGLVERNDYFTVKEEETLGLSMISKLYRCREDRYRQLLGLNYGWSLEASIEREFGDELRGMSDSE